MGHFYHFTPLENARIILHEKEGLRPRRRVLPLGLAKKFNLPAKAEAGAVFGLLEPFPESWVKGEYHKGEGILETVLGDKSGAEWALLKIETAPGDDVWVADHGFHLADDYNGKADLKNPATRRVKRAYWNSRVRLDAYTPDMKYLLPEVISFTPVPHDRICLARRFQRHELFSALREGTDRPRLRAPRRPAFDVNDILSGRGIRPAAPA